MKISEIVRKIIFPEHLTCIVCGDELSKEMPDDVCEKCKLPLVDNYCCVCGRQIPSMNEICDQCKNETAPYIAARSSCIYKDGTVKLVHKFKYYDEKYIAGIMAKYMARTYYSTDWNVDLVTSVPLHKRRKRERGYNQAEILGRKLGEIIGVPYAETLIKPEPTEDLVKHGKARRAEIVKDAFKLRTDFDVSKKSILLVDDVFTTGATTGECTRTLLGGGAGGVYVLTFASGEFEAETI